MEWLYVLGALLMLIVITVNVTWLVMKAKWRCCRERKSYDSVKVYDSEDQDVRVPIHSKVDPHSN